MVWMYFIVGFVLGLIFGWFVIPTAGTLHIDRTNPEKDIYQFDMKMDLEKIPRKKFIKLKVNSKATLESQEKQRS